MARAMRRSAQPRQTAKDRARELIAKYGRTGRERLWMCAVEKSGRRDLVDALAADGMSKLMIAAVVTREERVGLSPQAVQRHVSRACSCYRERPK